MGCSVCVWCACVLGGGGQRCASPPSDLAVGSLPRADLAGGERAGELVTALESLPGLEMEVQGGPGRKGREEN
jgi:hypothetical protein